MVARILRVIGYYRGARDFHVCDRCGIKLCTCISRTHQAWRNNHQNREYMENDANECIKWEERDIVRKMTAKIKQHILEFTYWLSYFSEVGAILLNLFGRAILMADCLLDSLELLWYVHHDSRDEVHVIICVIFDMLEGPIEAGAASLCPSPVNYPISSGCSDTCCLFQGWIVVTDYSLSIPPMPCCLIAILPKLWQFKVPFNWIQKQTQKIPKLSLM